jgi:hypothetical protein
MVDGGWCEARRACLAGCVLCLAFASGCASKSAAPAARNSASGPNAGSQAGTAGAASTLPSTGSDFPTQDITSPVVTVTTTGASGSAGRQADGCVGTMVSAPPPSNPKVDIVWVVDASASMLDEQMKIGANLSKFADDISKAELDVHIVMMTTSAAIPVICPVMPSDPLSGTPLASDPRYKFIETLVDSNNLLDVAASDYPMYSSFLRPDAALQFVFVTDDESHYQGQPTPDARATAFKADMEKLAGKPFTLHTISSDGPTACRDANCMPDANSGICVFVMLGCGAAAPGDTYYALAHSTNGLTASICESDWQTIFAPLTAAVIQAVPLPCSYTIPPPPKGELLEPGKVNVRFQEPTAGMDTLWPRAQSAVDCRDALGWYYDDLTAPKQVLLCPNSCSAVANGGTLNLSFGCATIELK